MTDFDFDTSTTAYAYVGATVTQPGFGHLTLTLRLPSLGRQGFTEGVYLNLHSQYSKGDNVGAERFYAIDLFACADTGKGLSHRNCVRTAKVMSNLVKAVDKWALLAGSPSGLLEDIMFRHILAAKVQHVFIPSRVNSTTGILQMERIRVGRSIPDNLRFQVQGLKHCIQQMVDGNLRVAA